MTQYEMVLAHFRKFGHMSQRDALDDYGITRLASRVDELRADGHYIVTEMKINPATGQRYARYHYKTFIGRPLKAQYA